MTVHDDLAHVGVKGMRWGVRKDNSVARTGSVTAKTTKLVSDDHARVSATKRVIKTSGTKAVSNKELQDVITRMNLEKQYSSLSNPKEKSKVNIGHSKVKQILGFAKTLQEVHSLATGGLASAVKVALQQRKVVPFGDVLAKDQPK